MKPALGMSLARSAVQTFGKYQILERIATGGMAEIYKARLEGIGGFQRTFAIKRILPHLSQNAEYVAMLVDEAKVAGLLSHANIVQILDLGQIEGVWYIAMEYVSGPDLGRVLRSCRDKGIELPVPHTVFVAIELLKGLEYAHDRQVMRGGRTVPLNIIHRDISPPNVLLSMQGEVKLTDFGIARASHKAQETASGIIKGRFDYMSPEQAAGARDLDQRSDLFSVGVVLYEMLTGVHPFHTDSEFATIDRIRTGRYEPVSSVNPGVPFTLETIIDRALRVDKNERYPNASAFKEALDKFFHDSGFIFSHHSLASYVRGLFPETPGPASGRFNAPASSPNTDAPTGVPAEPEPEPPDLFLDDDDGDGPTRVIGKDALRGMVPPPTDAGVFGLKTDDTATMVRRGLTPGGWDDDEPETVVRKTTDVLGIEPRTPPTPRAGTSLPPKTPAAPVPDDRPSIPPNSNPSPSVTERRPVRRWWRRGVGPWLALLVATTTFLLGLFLGTVVGVVAGQAISLQGSPVGMPIVQIEAPQDVIVRIDGRVVQGTVNLSPGSPHQLEVESADGTVARSALTLQPGELRVLVVSSPPTEGSDE
ncbi:MAG: serine/threonine protein kinase [Myxococcota bacterium]